MKISKVKDVRVVVYVTNPWIAITEEYRIAMLRDAAAEVAAQIKRHVDYIGAVAVVEEIAHMCEHCGYEWTESSTTYNGGCCDADEANNPNTQ